MGTGIQWLSDRRSSTSRYESQRFLAQWSVCHSGQSAFFEICVTNTNARALSSTQIYQRHEQEKKRKYNDRVMNIEQGTFTPLVYSTSGGLGNNCQTFCRQLANKIDTKTNDKYEKVLT